MATTRVYQENAVKVTYSLNALDCPNCGVVFGITDDYEMRRRTDNQNFYCPNGHIMSYGETEADRLRKELEKAKGRIAAERGWAERITADLDAERKSHASTKGQLTKTRKRIGNGVCPDCRRHFVNVERHMATKHARLVEGTEHDTNAADR